MADFARTTFSGASNLSYFDSSVTEICFMTAYEFNQQALNVEKICLSTTFNQTYVVRIIDRIFDQTLFHMIFKIVLYER